MEDENPNLDPLHPRFEARSPILITRLRWHLKGDPINREVTESSVKCLGQISCTERTQPVDGVLMDSMLIYA